MKIIFNNNLLLCTACLSLILAQGCAEKAGPALQTKAATVSEEGAADSEEETVAELTSEELALVEDQVFCPVGGKLGSMGTPVKVMVEGKPVFICCEGCRGPLLDDPDKYLAELEQKKQEAASEEEATEKTETTNTES